MRTATIKRQTKETNIELTLTILDAGKKGSFVGTSGIGFFDHMLNSFCVHGGFRMNLQMVGDLQVDGHHSVEDVGIVLGKLFAEILGDRGGIRRFGSCFLPMDEALILSAVDISGRAHLEFDAQIPAEKVGDFDTELCEEFFISFVRNADLTLHLKQLEGKNSHHIIEAAFKSVAYSLKFAVKINEEFKNEIPSTKGVL